MTMWIPAFVAPDPARQVNLFVLSKVDRKLVQLTPEQVSQLRLIVTANPFADEAHPDEVVKLVAVGILPESAQELLRSARGACDAGLGSLFPHEPGAHGVPTDPLLAEFYQAGRKAGESAIARRRRDRLLGLLLLGVVAAALVCYLIWKHAT
jgi:hypothetical protein